MHQPKAPTALILPALTLLLAWTTGGPSGCVSGSQPPLLVHEGPRAAVTLHALPAGSLRAAHPATLPESTIARVLGGIRVGTPQRLMQTLLAGDASPKPAFDAEAIAGLAPWVARALGRAGPDDYVSFEARQDAARGEELTGGVLYVKDGALVLALTDIHKRPGPGSPKGKAGGGPPLASVLPQLSITFEPRGVEVPLTAAPPAGMASPEHRPLAIDYRLLAKLTRLEENPDSPDRTTTSGRPPGAATTPVDAPVSRAGAEVQALKDLVIQKDLEIETLRREVERLRQSLGRSGAAGRD